MACANVENPPSKTPMAALSLTYKGNDRAHRVVEKVTITDGLHLRRYEVLKSLRHCLWATTCMASHHRTPGADRRRERKYSTVFLGITRKGHRQVRPALDRCQHRGKRLRDGWSAYELSSARRYPSTDQNRRVN